VFTARYALSPYIKQIRFVFKGLIFILAKCLSLCDCTLLCEIYFSLNECISPYLKQVHHKTLFISFML
jgi:hypothetical protein